MKMIVVKSVALVWVFSASAVGDQPPPNEPPNLWRASAKELNGKVVIQISQPKYKTPRKAVSAEAMKWHNLRQVSLGKFVRAFNVDGKRLDSKAVLNALRQPKGVAVFVRFYRPVLNPDPFYLAMLREGTVVFVVAADAIADPIP